MQIEIHDDSGRVETKKHKQDFIVHVSGEMQFPEIGIVFGTGKKLDGCFNPVSDEKGK